MAKYGKGAQKKVEEVMHEFKTGKLKSGKGGKGGKVKSRKQAIATRSSLPIPAKPLATITSATRLTRASHIR